MQMCLRTAQNSKQQAKIPEIQLPLLRSNWNIRTKLTNLDSRGHVSGADDLGDAPTLVYEAVLLLF